MTSTPMTSSGSPPLIITMGMSLRRRRIAIAASMLDRLAEVRRLYLQTGLDLEDVALLLAAAGELP